MNIESLNQQRNNICRLVFGCIFLLLMYDLLSHTAVHQLQSPTLVFPYVDITYLLFNASGIPGILISHYAVALLFDLLLYITCIAIIIYPSKKNFITVFLMLYFFYFLLCNDYGAHHIHSKIGILLIPIPFLFSGYNFLYAWNALRYFTLFLYADSFLWKLFRNSWLNSRQGIAILKENVIPILYAHPDNKMASLYYYLFDHPAFVDALYKVGFLLEGIFIIGFFTKRFDVTLFFISLILAFGFKYMADAFAFELLILNFTLLFAFKNYSLPSKQQALISSR